MHETFEFLIRIRPYCKNWIRILPKLVRIRIRNLDLNHDLQSLPRYLTRDNSFNPQTTRH